MNSSKFLSVGIDVGSAFSWMAIVDPQGNVISKPFKLIHNSLDSLNAAVLRIRKAEETESLKAAIFLESTGIYHIPLFCYLSEKDLDVHILNPLTTHSIKNIGIRKVKNDKSDAVSIAELGLKSSLKSSKLPDPLVAELRPLVRRYYELGADRAEQTLRLTNDLNIVFPQYLRVFSKGITGKTSLMILKEYGTPEKILHARRSTLIKKLAEASHQGSASAEKWYSKLVAAANDAMQYRCKVDSISNRNIPTSIGFIQFIDEHRKSILEDVHSLLNTHLQDLVSQQVELLETIPGVSFMPAVTIVSEIGDFSSFKKPGQLFAFFGMDPEVRSSGLFQASHLHMSKRGSRIVRHVMFQTVLAIIATMNFSKPIIPTLCEYYKKKIETKPRMVAIGALMHKLCNIIFAVLRDQKPFELRTPKEQQERYQAVHLSA